MGSELPSRIGPYVVTREIGRGGMGIVHLARDQKLGRDVAIKCLPDELAHDDERLRRMDREARLLASLNHPHIATIHGLEEVDGRKYLVLEHVDGEALEEFAARQRGSWRACVRVAASIADALAAAHARGVVHRDLKPDNVRFTRDGVVKLLDFGLACAAPAETGSEAVTVEAWTGAIMGTPGYMAPEQARGESADARSDVFAFGCLLHEMLTGRPAFARGTVADSLSATLKDDAVPPSQCGATSPGQLDAVVMRCLEKRPEDRFQSARDLAFALRSVLDGAGRGAAAPRPRRVRAAVAAGVVGLILLLAGAWLARNRGEAPPPDGPLMPRIAVLPFEHGADLAEKAYLAQTIPESIIDALSPISALHVVPRSTTARYRDWEGDIAALGAELDATGIVTGRIEARQGNLYVRADLVDVATGRQQWGRRFDRPLDDALAVEREITRLIVEVLKLELTREEASRLASRHPNNSAAYTLYLRGRSEAFKRDMPGLHAAIELYDEAIALEPTYALAYAAKADAYCMLGLSLIERPAELMPKAKLAAEKALAHGGNLGEVHAALGFIQWLWEWDFEQAVAEYRRATELNPKYAEAWHFLAHVLASQGRLDQAVEASKTARNLEPDKLVFSSCLGHFHAWNGDRSLGLEQLEDVVATNGSFGLARVYLGREYVAQDRPAEGVKQLRYLADTGPRLGDWIGDLPWALASAGETSEARDRIAALWGRAQTAYVPNIAFARAYAGLRETDQVIAALRAAVQERESVLPLIGHEPHFQYLLDDERFIEILADIGLPTGPPPTD